jgi:tyrosyl-tRNA synthetase
MDSNEKLDLITRNLQEVIGEEQLKELVEKKDISIYWGSAPTGSPSIGYLVPLYKIADFLKAGCKVTILFADLHAYLDSMKSDWDVLEHRTAYYEFLIKTLFEAIDVPTQNLSFVKGTDFQLSEKYTLDVYKLAAKTSVTESKKAGAEVVKQSDNPKLSGLLYPLLQALDEVHLQADAQFGGVDQRKIFAYARDNLHKIGEKKRVHLMNPLIPGLGKTGKMSSSEPDSKVDFYDTNKKIQKKISKAYCVDGECEGNGLLAILKYVLFHKIEHDNREFTIERPEQYGGTISFKTYQDVDHAFREKKLSSIDLKQGVAQELISFITPIRDKIIEEKELFNKAYPENQLQL